jgi:triosephosphate isomerase
VPQDGANPDEILSGKEAPQSSAPILQNREESKERKERSSKESLTASEKKAVIAPSPAALIKAGSTTSNEIAKGASSNIKDILKQQANVEHFIINYIVAGGKVTKLQVCGASNVTLMEVNLKKWEERA